MGADYYKILGVDRNVSSDDLKKAYETMAAKWNPDKYPDNRKEAEAKWNRVCEAYEVLNDPQKRAMFDSYGEEGLKGMSQGSPRSADDIFSEYFDFTIPHGGGGRRGSSSSSSNETFGDDDVFHSFNRVFVMGGPKKAPPIENRLPCTLEELYKGTTKKIKISREIVDINGNTIKVEEILTINVKPGWKKGTRITFEEKGNVQQNVKPADVVFIVDEKPHSVFTRDGNDLIVTQTITLGEALKGYPVCLTTLDGRSLNIPIDNVIHPTYEETVPREGMPIQNEPSKRGNLKIKFNIKFPPSLTAEQKAGIKFLQLLNRCLPCFGLFRSWGPN
ncbi:hypothetical protein AB3S75_007171 [Citrus x aurantiifolia]